MWPDRVSNPGPLTYESGALPIALRGPAAASIESPGNEARNGQKVTSLYLQPGKVHIVWSQNISRFT